MTDRPRQREVAGGHCWLDVRRARRSNKFLNELSCQRGVTAKWIWLLPFWSYLRSALVLDMRSASESLVCAAVGTTKAIHRIDRIICLRAIS